MKGIDRFGLWFVIGALLTFIYLGITGCGSIPEQQLAAPCLTSHCASDQVEHWGDVTGTQGYKISKYDDETGEAANKARRYFNDRGVRQMKEGNRGDKGDRGETGAKGSDGAAGQAGGNGADGAAGAAGADGSNGSDGKQGDPGADGAAGVDGKDGATGRRGPRGNTGRTGARGADGDDGTSCELERRNFKYRNRNWMTYDVYVVCGDDEEFIMYKRERRDFEDHDDD